MTSIYEKRKALILSAIPPSTATESEKREKSSSIDASKVTGTLTEFNFTCDLELQAGKCRILGSRTSRTSSVVPASPRFSRANKERSRQASATSVPDADNNSDDFRDQTVYLPGVSFSIDGKTFFGEDETKKVSTYSQRFVNVKQTIHPSENIFHPSVLQFFLDVLSKIDVGDEKPAMPKESREDVLLENSLVTTEAQKFAINYYLRLSQTKVGLSCQPVSKVSLSCFLEEANMLFSWTPNSGENDTQIVNITCEARQISGSLRHAFSPEDCLRGDLPLLNVNGALVLSENSRKYTLTLNIPGLSGVLNVRHLQDFFLFRSLWAFIPSTKAASRNVSDSTSQGSSFAALMRFPNTGQTADLMYSDGLHINLQLGKVEVTTDLGQAIGKASVTLEKLSIVGSTAWSPSAIEYHDAATSLSSVGIKMDGRYSGDASITKLELNSKASNAMSSLKLGADPVKSTLLSGTIDRVESQILYQYERIMIFELIPLQFELVHVWKLDEIGPFAQVDVNWKVNRVQCVVSRRTIPSMAQMLNKLLTLIKEKRIVEEVAVTSNDIQLSPVGQASSGGLKTDKTSSSVTSPSTPSENETARKVVSLRNASRVVATMKLTVENTFLTFMRYNFRDPDCALLISKTIVIQLNHEPGASLVETTTLELGGFSIKKGTAKAISQEEERMWNSAEWFTFLTSSPAKNVVSVPTTSMKLNATTSTDGKNVQLGFRTDFGGSIDIALNIGLYRHLQEMASYYTKALQSQGDSFMEQDLDKAPESATSAKTVTSPTASTNAGGDNRRGSGSAATGTSTVSDKAAGTPVGEAGSKSPTPANAPLAGNTPVISTTGALTADAAAGSSSTLAATDVVYTNVGDVKFDPQLKITGDATPSELVNWLGVNKDRVPQLVHKNLTTKLADLLVALEQLTWES
jgi:hypothetical protein